VVSQEPVPSCRCSSGLHPGEVAVVVPGRKLQSGGNREHMASDEVTSAKKFVARGNSYVSQTMAVVVLHAKGIEMSLEA